MSDSRMLEIAPDSEYNKLLLSEHERHYKDLGVDFHSNYQCFDREWEWKEPTTSRKAFAEIIKRIPIDKNWAFLDCGCGLGHTMYLASFYFNVVYGVELLEEVAEIAKRNLSKMLPGNSSCRVFSCDMFELNRAIINEARVFYISSPFMDEALFDKWIKMVLNSLQEAEREIWIIYYYPHCEHIMERYSCAFPMVDTLEASGKVNFYHHSASNS